MTIVTDVKAAAGTLVGGRVFEDVAPRETAYPYLTVDDEGGAPAHAGDGKAMAFFLPGTVHLWETRPQDDTLLPALVAALDGLRLTAPRVRCKVEGWLRVPVDPTDPAELVHHAITLRSTALP